jgi:hypothetical protein
MWGKNNQDHYTTAMIDCGATENVIDKKYAEQVGIPLDKKKIPQRVLAVNGREVASSPVTHDTTVELTTNNYQTMIKLYCITISNSPIILGLPWLKKHNPKINWREGKVMFDSDKYTKECLDTSPYVKIIPEEKAINWYHLDLAQDTTFDNEENSEDEEEPEGILKEWALYPDYESDSSSDQDNPLEETDTETPPIHQQPTEPEMEYQAASIETLRKITAPKKPELRDIMPLEYHEYLLVFEEKGKIKRPPYRYHDHCIPLIDNKILPFEPLCALDERRLKALKEYIHTSLERGWIRSSTSPAGAPIHFVKKKDRGLQLCIDYRGVIPHL